MNGTNSQRFVNYLFNEKWNKIIVNLEWNVCIFDAEIGYYLLQRSYYFQSHIWKYSMQFLSDKRS